MFSNNLTMMTDLYELTMMQGYFKNPVQETVIFDAFYRVKVTKIRLYLMFFTAKIHPAVLMPSPVDLIR